MLDFHAFAEPSKKVLSLRTKVGSIQNLCCQSHYTKIHHVCHREYYILHINCNTFRYHKCLEITRIQDEITKKVRFLSLSELNGSSLRVVDLLYECGQLLVFVSEL